MDQVQPDTRAPDGNAQGTRAPGARGPDVRALLIAALLFAGCSFLTTRSTLWDRDEPRFAVAALEMARSGQWLYPTFNGELRPDKPILIYWLMSASIRILTRSVAAVKVRS